LGEAALGALAENLHAHTAKSITDATAFLQEMAGIRTRGYAVNTGEWQETVCGVAAPIHDPAGGVIAAIGVSGPAERLRPGRFKALGVEVTKAADAVERALTGDAAPLAPFDPCAIGAPASSSPPATGRRTPQQEEKQRASE